MASQLKRELSNLNTDMKFAKPRDKAHELKRQSGSGQKLRVYLPTAPRTSGSGPHQKPTRIGGLQRFEVGLAAVDRGFIQQTNKHRCCQFHVPKPTRVDLGTNIESHYCLPKCKPAIGKKLNVQFSNS